MSRAATQVLGHQTRPIGRGKDSGKEWAKQGAIVIAASLFVALCARVTVPLPFTPVPLTLQNFGVLAVGLLLGSRRGFAALSLYLVEGVCGLPVFSPAILGSGITHILGPTGGYLMAYPLVAFVAAGSSSTLRAVSAGPRCLPRCGTRALRGRAQLACRTHSLRYSGAQIWSLLVRVCGSHQGADGRRRRRSLAPTAFFVTLNTGFVSWHHFSDAARSSPCRDAGLPRL